jgi:hypothetical protein
MSLATIFRIRCALVVRGLPAAVALYQQVRPLDTPADFIANVLGKTARVR